MPDAERVERAMNSFVRDFGRTAAIYMESCIHCGMCAEACHFYEVTQDPKYTPIWKLEPFKQAYKREYGPFALVYRALNLKPKVTVERAAAVAAPALRLLHRLRPLLADVPDGHRHRRAWSRRRGTACSRPGSCRTSSAAVTERAQREGSPLGATPKVFTDRFEWLADDHEVEIPLDKPKADVLVRHVLDRDHEVPGIGGRDGPDHETTSASTGPSASTATRPRTSGCCRATRRRRRN